MWFFKTGENAFLIGVALTLIAALLSQGPSFLIVARTAVVVSRKNAFTRALGLARESAVFSFSLAAGWYGVVAFLLSVEKPKRVYSSLKHIIDRVAGGIMNIL